MLLTRISEHHEHEFTFSFIQLLNSATAKENDPERLSVFSIYSVFYGFIDLTLLTELIKNKKKFTTTFYIPSQ